MEDFEMTQALRRYVEGGEPPFSLTANGLITQARRRQRWRLGMVIGGGGAATALAIVSAVALVPTAGGGPVLGSGGVCDVQLPQVPAPTPKPPPYPTDKPVDPSGPAPSGRPIPSGVITDSPRPYQTDKEPAPVPYPAPGGGSVDPTRTAIVIIDNPRLAEMTCFLKHRLLELRPDAKFAPHLGKSMEIRFASGKGADGRKIPAYEMSAYIVDGPLLCLFSVVVFQGDYGVSSGLGHSGNQAAATHKTASSTIVVTVEGGAIKDADILAIAKAPELDVFR